MHSFIQYTIDSVNAVNWINLKDIIVDRNEQKICSISYHLLRCHVPYKRGNFYKNGL